MADHVDYILAHLAILIAFIDKRLVNFLFAILLSAMSMNRSFLFKTSRAPARRQDISYITYSFTRN